MKITNIRKIYGEDYYLVEIDGRSAVIPINPKSGIYASLLRAVDGEVVTEIPRATLSADKLAITADGVDQAIAQVEVSGVEPLPASIDVELTDGAGSSTHAIPLSDGQSQAYPVTASEPTTLTIRVNDQVTYNDAGGIEITAVEA